MSLGYRFSLVSSTLLATSTAIGGLWGLWPALHLGWMSWVPMTRVHRRLCTGVSLAGFILVFSASGAFTTSFIGGMMHARGRRALFSIDLRAAARGLWSWAVAARLRRYTVLSMRTHPGSAVVWLGFGLLWRHPLLLWPVPRASGHRSRVMAPSAPRAVGLVLLWSMGTRRCYSLWLCLR